MLKLDRLPIDLEENVFGAEGRDRSVMFIRNVTGRFEPSTRAKDLQGLNIARLQATLWPVPTLRSMGPVSFSCTDRYIPRPLQVALELSVALQILHVS